MIRQNDWGQLRGEGGTGPAIAAGLEEACFFVNLFSDDAWQPWTLEFFCRSDDDQKRLDFLRAAEALQLYCEVRCDAAFAADRWARVARELLTPRFYWDRVRAALGLTAEEQEDFLQRLGARDLAAAAEERTLAHLLLRADSINRARVDWRRLKVEKILPQHPPEGSLWRRVKILVPEDGGPPLPAIADGGGGGSSGGGPAGGGWGGGAPAASSRAPTAAGGRAVGAARVGGSTGGEGGGGEGGRAAAGLRRSSSSVLEGSGFREVKYWYEVQRSHWHNRLGNLVLLQPSAQAARAGGHAAGDITQKLAYLAACGADESFPEFTGGLVAGRYARDGFSPEEARARHGDIIARLAAVLGLCQEWE